MNRSFPQSLLLQVERSQALPDYLRSKFAIAIWLSGLPACTGNIIKITRFMIAAPN